MMKTANSWYLRVLFSFSFCGMLGVFTSFNASANPTWVMEGLACSSDTAVNICQNPRNSSHPDSAACLAGTCRSRCAGVGSIQTCAATDYCCQAPSGTREYCARPASEQGFCWPKIQTEGTKCKGAECKDGFICFAETAPGGGECRPGTYRSPLGGVCVVHAECAGNANVPSTAICVNNRCQAPASECETDANCPSGNACILETGATGKKCISQSALGASCTKDANCLGLTMGAKCSANKCAETCSVGTASNKICLDRTQACDVANGWGFCRPPAANGQSCSRHDMCQSLNCVSGVCTARPAAGTPAHNKKLNEPCTTADDCETQNALVCVGNLGAKTCQGTSLAKDQNCVLDTQCLSRHCNAGKCECREVDCCGKADCSEDAQYCDYSGSLSWQRKTGHCLAWTSLTPKKDAGDYVSRSRQECKSQEAVNGNPAVTQAQMAAGPVGVAGAPPRICACNESTSSSLHSPCGTGKHCGPDKKCVSN